MKFADRLSLAPFGTLGGFIPYIVKLYNEVDQFAFVFQWKYLFVFVLFGLTAATVAVIYPYKKPTPWKALVAGFSFTTSGGTIAGLARPRPGGSWLGGENFNNDSTWSSFLDYISIF